MSAAAKVEKVTKIKAVPAADLALKPADATPMPAETAAAIGAAIETVTDPFAGLIEIPAKICVQIGQRKRYFDTREEALEALTAFKTKGAGKVKGPSRTFLTAEQKAQKAADRSILMEFAAKQGKEGKNAAALANTLEDIITSVPGVLALIANYNEQQGTPNEEPAIVLSGNVVEVAQGIVTPEPTDVVDPLAEFAL